MEPGERTGGRQDGNSNRRGKIGDRGLVRAVNVVTYPTLSSRHRTGQKEQISSIQAPERTNRQTIRPFTKKPPNSTIKYFVTTITNNSIYFKNDNEREFYHTRREKEIN